MKPSTLTGKPGKSLDSIQYILDTSSLVAHLIELSVSSQLKRFIPRAGLPFVALTELYYIMWRKAGQPLADQAVQHVLSWHLPLLVPDEQLSLLAGDIKIKFSLGIADSYVAAFAIKYNASLITKDSDFQVFEPRIKIINLTS